MPWRKWSVIVLLLLANYLVFSLFATLVFPPPPITAPTHIPKATFTRGVFELRSVGTLSYDFLTPTATATLKSTQTITATGAPGTPPRTTAPTKGPD